MPSLLLACLICTLAAGAEPTAAEPWIDSDPLVAQTLLISAEERERLIRLESAGLQTVRPVALPRGAYLKGDNKMLGWPVAAKVGNTLVCVYHQWLTHTGRPRTDADSSEAIVLRSTDNGHTWSDPIDIRQFGVNSGTMALGFGNCLGVLGNKVFLATDYGLYRSGDEGASWQLIPDVLTQAQTGVTVRDNFGPRMIIHPTRGLVICVAPELSQPYMDVYSSQDEGATWQRERVALSNTYNPVEPTGFYHDGRLIFLSRNHTIPLGATTHPSMMISETGWFPFTHKGISNISSFGWPDTTDVDFNPVTRRYEAVVTNRRGGVGDNERNQQHEQTVNLWSISKADLQAGHADRWRYEGTLLRLKSGWLDQTAEDIDAAHPAGAVVDVAQGVQHVFIYCGTFGTPTAIYRITRTLDTAKLSPLLRQTANLSFEDPEIGGTSSFAPIGWTENEVGADCGGYHLVANGSTRPPPEDGTRFIAQNSRNGGSVSHYGLVVPSPLTANASYALAFAVGNRDLGAPGPSSDLGDPTVTVRAFLTLDDDGDDFTKAVGTSYAAGLSDITNGTYTNAAITFTTGTADLNHSLNFVLQSENASSAYTSQVVWDNIRLDVLPLAGVVGTVFFGR